MEENILKKEFKKGDVQRIRNIMQKKQNDSTTTQVGYKKIHIERTEGDIWEEDGRQWTIKDGIKQNITKLDKAKQSYVTPIFCPSCNKPMKKRFDGDYYKIHKMCFDCVIKFETNLRRLGTYEEYEKNIHNSEINGFIGDYKSWIDSQLNESNNSFVTEAGDVEKWVGGVNKERVLEDLEETIKYLEKMKK